MHPAAWHLSYPLDSFTGSLCRARMLAPPASTLRSPRRSRRQGGEHGVPHPGRPAASGTHRGAAENAENASSVRPAPASRSWCSIRPILTRSRRKALWPGAILELRLVERDRRSLISASQIGRRRSLSPQCGAPCSVEPQRLAPTWPELPIRYDHHREAGAGLTRPALAGTPSYGT